MGVRKDNPPVRKENLAGGTGVVNVRYLLEDGELYSKGKMFAKVSLDPGASIGWHEHFDEVEYYYILSGKGKFTNPDGTVSDVVPGDVCTMCPDQGHAIANTGDEPLDFMALILYNK
jgi:quercetin dioxygenase-like cupin family protein